MKEKFNSLKGKLNLKILALLPLLLTLTGCGGDTKYLHHTLSATNWDFGGVISEALEKAGLEVAQFINGIFAKIILILYNLPTKVKEITFDSLSNYAMIGKVISLVQILAIALIIVN